MDEGDVDLDRLSAVAAAAIRVKDWTRASALYGRFAADDPDDAAALGLRAYALSRQGRHAEAIQAADAALAHPALASRWMSLRTKALSLVELERYDEAFLAFAASLAERDNPHTRNLFGGALAAVGRKDDARAQYEISTQRFPDDDAGWFCLGASLSTEDPARALRCIESALEIYPDEPGYHAGAAIVASNLGNVEVTRYHVSEVFRLGAPHPDDQEEFDHVLDWLHRIDRRLHPRCHPAKDD